MNDIVSSWAKKMLPRVSASGLMGALGLIYVNAKSQNLFLKCQSKAESLKKETYVLSVFVCQ